jgi:hypothetical protein
VTAGGYPDRRLRTVEQGHAGYLERRHRSGLLRQYEVARQGNGETDRAEVMFGNSRRTGIAPLPVCGRLGLLLRPCQRQFAIQVAIDMTEAQRQL